MHLKALSVKNFRALDDIHVDFDSQVNVIVGPNAIGKTTLLEAIRLNKALLAARTASEPTQALMAIGAVAPYNPQRLIPERIARDPAHPIEVRCRYEITEKELGILAAAASKIATVLVQSQMGQSFANPAIFIPFLSSLAGQAALTQAEKDVAAAVDTLRINGRLCRLDLNINLDSMRIENSADQIGALFIGFLESQLAPHLAAFSYFPADRAMPQGEPAVQLGAADAGQQLESHNSQPQLKYQRLKNTIFNAVVMSPEERKSLEAEFARIFEGLLKGRKLIGVGINQHGLLSISIQDTETGRIFDVDNMSSGEKGLILTFLLIGRSVIDGGIILIDEPELHLNPAVCRDLLTFLVDEYVAKRNLQVIMCSHSPDILGAAFDRDECTVYHLMSETVLSKVRRQDQEEVSEALRRLGTSESEGLLYRATIFVEGEEDVEILQVGFGDILRRHKLKDLGGRREIEKQISRLQDAEQKGDKLSPKYFIFDRDEAPTGLVSSETIKILQWKRRCLENYLIDFDVLTELIKDSDVVGKPLPSQGEVVNLLRELAMSQIDAHVAKKVYDGYQFINPGLRSADFQNKNLDGIADSLFGQLSALKGQMCGLIDDTWKTKFLADCGNERRQLEPVWLEKWRDDCNGKQLFKDLHQRVHPRMPLLKFKKRVMSDMRRIPGTENWRAVESLLKDLIA